MILKSKNLFTIFCFLCLGQLKAQIITDRPDQTESSSTVGSGNLQIDFSFGAGLNHTMNYISLGCSWLILKQK